MDLQGHAARTLTAFSLRLLIQFALKVPGRTTITDGGGGLRHLGEPPDEYGAPVRPGGFMATQRGRGGGLELTRPAHRITAGEVVCAIKPDMDLVPCFGGGACTILQACCLKRALHAARKAFLGMLDATTVADLAQPDRRLGDLIGIVA